MSENSTMRQHNEAISNHTQRPEALSRRAERRLVSATRLLKRGRVIFLPPWLLLGGVILIIFVKLIGSWTFASSSTTIASFLDTNEDKSSSLGQAIADSLAFELDRIYQLHMMKNPWESPNQIHSLPLTTLQPYERVGAISVAGVQLPVGELFVALKPLFPHFRTYKALTGTIQKFRSGEKTYLARIIARLEEDGKIRKQWISDRELTSDAYIPDLVKELAFKIMWSTLEGIETRSFDAFNYATEGVYWFRTYKDTHDLVAFLQSQKNLQSAIAEDEKYAKAHFYLGHLYTWRAFYDKDGSEDFEELAKTEYIKTIQSYTSKLNYSKVLGNFGLGLVAYRHYIKEKNANEWETRKGSLADPKLEMAYNYFIQALDLKKDFYPARTGLALVYKEKGNIDCARREFQNAKDTEEGKAQRQWIEKEIEKLEEIERLQVHDAGTLWSWLLAMLGWLGPYRTCIPAAEVP